jgi:hypothetical protein
MSQGSFTKLMKNGGPLSTYSMDDIKEELMKRDNTKNVFPLDVFPEMLKPFINCLNKQYDIPRSFVGLSLLSAYSTAIGTAYTVTTNGKDLLHLPVWAALVGISSSGKTIALNHAFQPLTEIQNELDYAWEEKTAGLTLEQINRSKLDTVVYRDAHIPTLVRSILPDNPKGVVKMSDELLEWINGMNQLSKKEGTDEQFWISSWNCTNYSGIRSGKQKFVIHKPFVNVIGGAQYSVLPRMFGKDRDTTGFIFRLLFALPDADKIAEPDPTFDIPEEWSNRHKSVIYRLYKDLPVEYANEKPRRCRLSPDAVKVYMAWTKTKIRTINALTDLQDRDIHSGILGKIKEYCLRFAGILHLVDRALQPGYEENGFLNFKQEEVITSETMERSLRLAEYFYASASEIYYKVQTSMTAPAEVLIAATMMKMGKDTREMAALYYGFDDDKYKLKMWRQVKKWILEYPKVFNAVAR